MVFYRNYSALILKIYQKIKNHIPDAEPLADLLAGEDSIAKRIEVDDVAAILKELFYIDWLLTDLSVTLEFSSLRTERTDLTETLIAELNVLIHEQQIEISPNLLKYWLTIHFDMAEELIKGLGKAKWLAEEIATTSEPYSPGPEDDELQLSLLHVILNRNVRLGFLPPKEWYFQINELKILSSRDAILQLAFNDLYAFQCLDDKFPGFLTYAVTCFEDLSIFCQLLPDNAESLLRAPQVKPFLKSSVHYARIIEKLNWSQPLKLEVLDSFITNLDDLIAVINSYSLYAHLIATEQEQPKFGFTPYLERPCSRFITTREELSRFDLSNIVLLDIIYNTPRLRALAGTSNMFLLDTMNHLIKHEKTKPLMERSSLTHGFFQQLLPKPFLPTTRATVDKRLLTLGKAINYMQNLEGAGYYSSGNIQFSNDIRRGDFRTQASEGQVLAIALSHRAFQVWQQLEKHINQHFEIMECGGGEGDLCFKMLKFINSMGHEDKNWQRFAKAIHYTILELSPALVARQKAKLNCYIVDGVVAVIQDDALKMEHYKTKAHLHISNELMDMFEADQIIINQSNRPEVVMAVPVLVPEAYDYLLKHHKESVAGLAEEATNFSLLLNHHKITIDHEGWVITAKRFKTLLGITANAKFTGPDNCFLFTMSSLPVNLYPVIEQFIADHDDVLMGLHPGDTKIICPSLDVYAERLKEKAEVSVVIDYGECTRGLNNVEFRSFGPRSQLYENLPLISPGKKDITYDVDESVLGRSLIKNSPRAQVSMFNMVDLLPELFAIPPGYADLCSIEHVKKFRETNFFAACFISPEVDVKLPDLGTKDRSIATKAGYFFAIKEGARRILNANRIEKGGAITP